MKIKSAIYLNAVVLAIGFLAYLLPMPYSAIGISLAGITVLISIGFAIKRGGAYVFDKYPAESFGIAIVLIGSILCKVGYDNGSLMRKVSRHGKTVPGIVKGGYLRSTKGSSGRVEESYVLDVSYMTVEGTEMTGSFPVPEALGRKHVEFHTAQSAQAKVRAATAKNPIEQAKAEIESFQARRYGLNAFDRDAKPYVAQDASVEVRYVVGEPATAVILGAEPQQSDIYFLFGIMLGMGGVGLFVYGIKSRAVDIVLPHLQPRRKPQVQLVPKVIAAAPLVFISRDGAQLGSYPKNQLPNLLQNRILLPTDLAWQDGMSGWETLEAMLGK